MFPPRLDVAVLPAMREMVGLPSTKRTPSSISEKKPLRPASDPGFGVGSGRRIHHSDSTDKRNDVASTVTARAAPTIWMRKPASAGPTICATDPVTCSLLLPSTRSDREMIAGRYD